MPTNINIILGWFKTGKKPTEKQFWDSWLSFWHKDEQIPQNSVANLTDTLDAKVGKSIFDSHQTDKNAHAALLNLKEDKSEKGQANGYAPLDENQKISTTYLPTVPAPVLDSVLAVGNISAKDITLQESYFTTTVSKGTVNLEYDAGGDLLNNQVNYNGMILNYSQEGIPMHSTILNAGSISVKDEQRGDATSLDPTRFIISHSGTNLNIKGENATGTEKNLQLPNANATLAVAVNGNAADASGNITLPIDTTSTISNLSTIQGTTATAALNTLNSLKADLSSPTFTDIPNAPTAAIGTNTSQIATTAFVAQAMSSATDTENVKLTGNQSVSGNKLMVNTGSNLSIFRVLTQSDAANPGIIATTASTTQPALRVSATSANDTTAQKIAIGQQGTTGLEVSNIDVNTNPTSRLLVLNNTASKNNGVPLTVIKNTATVASISDVGDITGLSFVKTGGTKTQFLKADGSIDSNTYITTSADSNYLKLTGAQTIGGEKTISNSSGALYLSSVARNSTVFKSEISGIANISPSFSTANDIPAVVLNSTNTGVLLEGRNSGNPTFTLDKTGNATANSFIKTGGTSNQYLRADGTSSVILSGSAILNLSSASSDATLQVEGAELSDVVSLGIDHACVTKYTEYYAWVSSLNTVTVRVKNLDQPVSGLFKVKVFK
jgi:hypothetical protein